MVPAGQLRPCKHHDSIPCVKYTFTHNCLPLSYFLLFCRNPKIRCYFALLLDFLFQFSELLGIEELHY